MNNEVTIRLGIFLGVLITMAAAELLFPKRHQNPQRQTRWLRNLSLVAIDTVLVRILVPFTAAGLAIWAQAHSVGLFNLLEWPFTLTLIVSIVALDLIIYGQHVAFHHIPVLWRLHQIHHIDQEFDVTTGVRFHPVEIILSTLLKCAAVLLLGVPFIAVVVFEVLLNATALFNHANIRISSRIDRLLRYVIVTPDMHRIHHSVHSDETNSNFGFNLTWWDWIFRTYRADPKEGHGKMQLGLLEHQTLQGTGVWRLLTLPFLKSKHGTRRNDPTCDESP